jgi:hypothetical protein
MKAALAIQKYGAPTFGVIAANILLTCLPTFAVVSLGASVLHSATRLNLMV